VLLPLWLADAWPAFARTLTAEEPLVVFEGISIWPTEAIRLFALVLCCYLLCAGWRSLSLNLDWISGQFGTQPTREVLSTLQDKIDKKLKPWRRLAQMFPLWYHAGPRRANRASGGLGPQALQFWTQHIVQNRLGARLIRTTAWVIAALVLSCLLIPALGDEAAIPRRGLLASQVHQWLRGPALVLMYFLIFFVVDATLSCVFFVRGLRKLRVDGDNWPTDTLRLFYERLRLPKQFLDNWIDLQFIALRTRAVAHLIYYPFIIVSLWLLSKNSKFDHWTMTAATVVPAIAGAAIAMGCAIALRVSAERSRLSALTQVREALLRASARADAKPATPPKVVRTDSPQPSSDAALDPPSDVDPTREQLLLLQTRIESLHEGAFAPFWQQPLLKALLLPFATLGGTQLLDYMALANL